MAHPADGIRVQPFKQRTICVVSNVRFAVFPVFGTLHTAAQHHAHQLPAVADAEDRNACVKQARIAHGCAVIRHAVRPARKNDADRFVLKYLFQRRVTRQYFRIYAQIAHTPRNQLVVLSTEIQNDYCFSHASLRPSCIIWCFFCNVYIVRVILRKPRACNLNKLGFLPELFKASRTAVAHT